MSLFLQAQMLSKSHETVYPAERSAFSEVCDSFSAEDQKLIAEEFMFAWEEADGRGVEFNLDFFNVIEPELVSAMTKKIGRA